MLVLNGRRISELERRKQADDGDFLVISRNYNPKKEAHFSKKVSFGSFVDSVNATVSANLMVSSMAFEDKDDYARKNHGHEEYSNVRVYLRDEDPSLTYLDVATLTVSDADGEIKDYVVKSPVQSVEKLIEKPRIGELKFLAVPSLGNIDIDSENFDGWVYPDGSEFQKSRFLEAWEMFKESDSSTTFRVPNLSAFFKPNPEPTQVGTTRTEGKTEGIPAHTHGIRKDSFEELDVKLDVSTQIPVTPNDDETGGSNSIHSGSKQMNNSYLTQDQYELVVGSINITSATGELQVQSDSSETYPNHNLIPVMIYIGGAKK
jgi:hypothetical protein